MNFDIIKNKLKEYDRCYIDCKKCSIEEKVILQRFLFNNGLTWLNGDTDIIRKKSIKYFHIVENYLYYGTSFVRSQEFFKTIAYEDLLTNHASIIDELMDEL